MIDIKSLFDYEVEEFVLKLGLPKFRAKQIVSWLQKGVSSFEEMTNLPKNVIANLKEKCYITNAVIERKLVSKIDGTVKYLFSFADNECVESVVMKYHHGYSICVSTQVGCKMGCTFCATGKSGYSRNLTASEILAQIEAAQKDLNIRISNVVLMGMGEPLDNFDNVIKFLKIVSSEQSLNIGTRHISLSTCGIVPKIYELADMKLQITLSVSLHAPFDEIRSKTMPINNAYNITQLIKACRYYVNKTNRRITFEYAMIDGVNDSKECAQGLSQLLRGLLCHVNLIPVNTVNGTGYTKSKTERQKQFIDILSRNGVNATIRRTLGSDINASCGQLKRNYKEGGI